MRPLPHNPGELLARRFVRLTLAALVGLGVLLIFFCPMPRGPFQATHGPTTALRAARAAMLVFLSIAAASAAPFLIDLASLFLLLFLASLLFEGDSGDLMPTEDPVCVTCELRC